MKSPNSSPKSWASPKYCLVQLSIGDNRGPLAAFVVIGSPTQLPHTYDLVYPEALQSAVGVIDDLEFRKYFRSKTGVVAEVYRRA